MIVLFTSNISGGVLQFVAQILRELVDLEYDVVAFIPKIANVTIESRIERRVIRYDKVKTINSQNKHIKELADEIMKYKPALIWYFDNCVVCSEVSSHIQSVPEMIIMHDAGTSHSTNMNSIMHRFRSSFEHYMSRKLEKKCKRIMLLSDESKKTYLKIRPQHKDKIVQFNLGAHVPDVEAVRPSQEMPESFYLFFGRIDKYKGIGRLLKAYHSYKGSTPLVIAGKGTLSEDEKVIANNDGRITLINRYISDEEMVWLFDNCRATVLPYTEATQSGIIPIGYKHGKPAIVSNVPGLSQVVIDGVTGKVCNTIEDFTKAFGQFENIDMKTSCKKYYDEKMNWKNNINKLFSEIGVTR